MNLPTRYLQNAATTTRTQLLPTRAVLPGPNPNQLLKDSGSSSPVMNPDDEGQIDWDPYTSRLSLNFGTVGPSAGRRPWVLERKNAWNLMHWLAPSGGGGLELVSRAKTVRLVLSEEFLFDTIDPKDTRNFRSYLGAAHQHRDLTPWDKILATLRWAFQKRSSSSSLKKQQQQPLDLVVEIHVQGLGRLSSMSDCGVGEEQNSQAVLRPTAGVYADFMHEFTRFGPGMIREVRLSGLFPGDWAGLIGEKMPGTRVTKDLSHFVNEMRWWTAAADYGGHHDVLFDLEGQPESEVRRRHAEARWVMLNGAGHGSDRDEWDSDPGYESDVHFDGRT